MRGCFIVALRALFCADEIGAGDLGWRDDGALDGDAGNQEESPGRQTHKNEPGPAGFSALSMHGGKSQGRGHWGGRWFILMGEKPLSSPERLGDLGKHDSAYFDQAHANIVFCAPQGETPACRRRHAQAGGGPAIRSHRRPFSAFICPVVFAVSAPGLGEVTEWSIVPDSKSGVPKGTVGSNPTLSAT